MGETWAQKIRSATVLTIIRAAFVLCCLAGVHSMDLATKQPARLQLAFQAGHLGSWAEAATCRSPRALTKLWLHHPSPFSQRAAVSLKEKRRAYEQMPWLGSGRPNFVVATGLVTAAAGVSMAAMMHYWRRRSVSTRMNLSADGKESNGGQEKLSVLIDGEEFRARFADTLIETNKELLLLGPDASSAALAGKFDANTFFSRLRTVQLGRVLLYAPLVSSTQTLLFKQIQNEEDGVICLADRQSSGRGRGENVWTSPEGCLSFSLSTSLNDATLLPFFQYLVSMAVYQAVSNIIGSDAKKAIGLQLKWPNDIYGPNMSKIGGVLCESSVKQHRKVGEAAAFYICAGVGINVDNEKPTTCLRELMTQNGLQEQAKSLTREVLLAEFCAQLEVLTSVLSQMGFGPLRDKYTSMWMHAGQVVKVQDQEGRRESATICGITPSGFLMARNDHGDLTGTSLTNLIFVDRSMFDPRQESCLNFTLTGTAWTCSKV